MKTTEVYSGLLSGVISAIVFNPIDKIIFSCCIEGKSLFSRETFRNLFKGSLNNVGTRLITSGLYFTYIDYYASITESKAQVSLMTAMLCGITSPMQLVKYNSWYNNSSTYATAMKIYKTYGLKGFAIGCPQLVLRDFLFNYIYLSNKKKDDHLNNVLVISTALVVTSPANLVRNMKYSKNESLSGIIKNFKFSQLGLGMIIGRNCLCFYSSQIIYDCIKSHL